MKVPCADCGHPEPHLAGIGCVHVDRYWTCGCRRYVPPAPSGGGA